ncbi:MAG: hypothetical protein WA872_16550 [Candidatus Sulfotelmatobacter sp.]
MKKLLRTRNVFLAALFIGLFAMAARNVTDPDVWWHLKTGQYIAQHRSVPHTDPFSYTRAGQPWVAHEWLSELLLYEIERTAGWAGLIMIFAAVLSAAFFLLYLRCGPATYVAGVATIVAAWATVPVWGVRPQVLSLLLISLWLLILDRSDRNPELLWWTLPLTLLWVNLHAGFAVGLALSALYLAGEWIERAPGRSRQSPSGQRIAALIFLLDVLIVPLNPNGLRMFSYPFETLRSAAMQKYIAEWASPNFHHPEYWPFLLIVLATFAALSWSRLELRLRDLLLLLVSLYAALVSIRLIPLFVLIAVPLVATRLGSWPRSDGRRLQSSARTLLNGLILLAMAAFAGVHIAQIIQRQPQVEIERFPARAAAFLQNHPPSGRIFNHYDWGGYLIWKLYPSTPVFIDGRDDLYGQQLFDQFAETYQFKGDWQQTLKQWSIDTVIVPSDSPLATGLRSSPGWTVSYEDPQAVVLTAPPFAMRRESDSAKPSIAKPNPQSSSQLESDAKAAKQLPSVCKKLHLLKHFAGYYEGD